MTDTPPRRRRTTQSEPRSVPPQDAPKMPEEPPRATSRQETKQTATAPGKPIQVLQNRLERFFVGMALPFAAAGDMHCAAVLAQRGPVVAEAWANLAAESPAVKKVLESLLKGGAWAGAISTTHAMIVPIAAHHGAPIPDFASAVLFGSSPSTQNQPEQGEPIVTPPPTSHTNGNGTAPGPAAVSLPSQGRSDGPGTDPGKYPGPHNSPME